MTADLMILLADLAAAESLDEMIIGNVRQISADIQEYEADIGCYGKMRFRPNHPSEQAGPDRALMANDITRILVTSVEPKRV